MTISVPVYLSGMSSRTQKRSDDSDKGDINNLATTWKEAKTLEGVNCWLEYKQINKIK